MKLKLLLCERELKDNPQTARTYLQIQLYKKNLSELNHEKTNNLIDYGKYLKTLDKEDV